MFLLILSTVYSQNADLYMPLNVKQAYTNNTRSLDGSPGSDYWQNEADYRVHITLEPKDGTLTGTEEIDYFNNSPDSLQELVIHLFPNIYKKGNSREFNIDANDASDGVILDEILVNSKIIDQSDSGRWIEYLHNDIKLHLEQPLYSGEKIKLSITWHFTENRDSHMRTGMVDSTSYFIAYFFPRVAVYDDIDGWNYHKYSGIAEFYNDFGSFDVSIIVPDNYIVWATGQLQNGEEILSDTYYKRLQNAQTSDSIIHIIDSTECLLDGKTTSGESNIWHFKATHVNDFAFAVSNHYLWDATSLVVDENSGRRVLIEAAYNKNSKDFYEVATIARQSIDFMSNQFPGIPFPFSSQTIFNGLDEMEYPMMVNDKSVDNKHYLLKLTSHEISHSYFPFYMGINETKYGWMDESWACYIEYQICERLGSAGEATIFYSSTYKELQGQDLDLPIISPSIYLKRPVYHINTYAKPATFLFILRSQLGEEIFKKCVHEFINQWNGRHPTPYDFFYALNYISKQNLNWLIKPWFFEFGYVDFAIRSVTKRDRDYKIIIDKKGNYPAPLNLKIVYNDETVEWIREPVSIWKEGISVYTITKQSTKDIRSIEIDDPVIPDADQSDNYFELEGSNE
jgi:hypothetical protein